MTEVFCFSGSGHSLAVAEFAAEALNCPLGLIPQAPANAMSFETAVIVFPVYCQNIPAPVKRFLKDLRANNVVLIATYGNISSGNVLWEAKKLVRGTVTAGVCVPMGHTFLNGPFAFDKESLGPVFQRIREPREAKIPRRKKNPFASFFPAWRSRVSVKIVRADSCDRCNLCGSVCPMGAVQYGVTDQDCIRCLHCVTTCPQKALSFETGAVLSRYLTKSRAEKKVKIYL